jgi:hypothetical protein
MRAKKGPRMRNGVPLFKPKKGAERPNLELVNRLRDDELPTRVSGVDRAARVSKRPKLDP